MREKLKRDDSFQATDELIEALQPYGSVLSHPARKELFRRGEQAHGIFLLETGSARLTIPGAIDRGVGPGALLGVPGTLSKGVYSLSAELLEESRVLFVPAERVVALLTDHPEVGYQLVQVLSREIQTLRERIVHWSGKVPLP